MFLNKLSCKFGWHSWEYSEKYKTCSHCSVQRYSVQRLRDTRMRRVLNVMVASIAIIVVLPTMLLIGLLVKLTSRGPIIYRQKRVGLNRRGHVDVDRRDPPDGVDRRENNIGGDPFVIYKFRTMRENVGDVQVWAKRNDPRITALGSFLRKYRLDELPQLFNVLKGDMNIVGPRPEQPMIFLEIHKQIFDYNKRQDVLPGITGLAQVSQSADSSLQDVLNKLVWDLEYVNSLSTKQDLGIMVRTVPVMVFQNYRRW